MAFFLNIIIGLFLVSRALGKNDSYNPMEKAAELAVLTAPNIQYLHLYLTRHLQA